MKLYYFQALMHLAFRNHPFAKIVNMHQSSNGWVGVIKDQIDGTEYVFHAVAVKSEKIVAPNSADQLLKMNGESNA